MNWVIAVAAYNALLIVIGDLVPRIPAGWVLSLAFAGFAIPLPAWIYATLVVPFVPGYFTWWDRYSQVASGAKPPRFRTVFYRPWVWFPRRVDLALITPEELRERERQGGQVFLGFIAAMLFFYGHVVSRLILRY